MRIGILLASLFLALTVWTLPAKPAPEAVDAPLAAEWRTIDLDAASITLPLHDGEEALRATGFWRARTARRAGTSISPRMAHPCSAGQLTW